MTTPHSTSPPLAPPSRRSPATGILRPWTHSRRAAQAAKKKALPGRWLPPRQSPMGPPARQRAGRHNSSPNTANPKSTACATRSKLSATRHCRSERISRKKPQCRVRQTLLFLLLAAVSLAGFALSQFALAQFTALAFYQPMQGVEQLRVALAQNFHQKRERQGRSRTRIQKMKQGLPCSLAPQLISAEARSVAERPAFLRPRQQALLEQPVQRGHHRGVCQFRADIFNQFTHSRIAARPQPVEQALLQRSKLLRNAAKWRKYPLHSLLSEPGTLP